MGNLAIVIERASFEDAEEILGLQKLAYASEAEIYDDYSIQPLNQTLEQIQSEFANQTVLKAYIDVKIVGSVRGFMREGTCHIGKLIVHPDFQNLGIGTRLLEEIEKCYKRAERYELFTGHRSIRNLYLYRKLGYKPFASEVVTDNLTSIFLEKPIHK